MVIRQYISSVLVNSKTGKGQSFFRRLFKRQQCIINGFTVTRGCPRVL